MKESPEEPMLTQSTRLLIAYDGTAGADCALEELRRAGLPRACDATVLTVAHGSIPGAGTDPSSKRPPERILEDARALATRAVQRLRQSFPGWDVNADARGGSPATTIVEVADDLAPDLLVLGCKGDPTPVERMLGVVARRVVTEAHCSVRICRPPRSAPGEPVRILFACDTSGGARDALDSISARSWPDGSEVRVVAADDLDQYVIFAGGVIGGIAGPPPRDPDAQQVLRKAVTDAEERLALAGLAASSEVKEGDPRRIMLDEVEGWKPDCVFVGATSRGKLERFLLGSVSATLVEHAACSVEVSRAI